MTALSIAIFTGVSSLIPVVGPAIGILLGLAFSPLGYKLAYRLSKKAISINKISSETLKLLKNTETQKSNITPDFTLEQIRSDTNLLHTAISINYKETALPAAEELLKFVENWIKLITENQDNIDDQKYKMLLSKLNGFQQELTKFINNELPKELEYFEKKLASELKPLQNSLEEVNRIQDDISYLLFKKEHQTTLSYEEIKDRVFMCPIKQTPVGSDDINDCILLLPKDNHLCTVVSQKEEFKFWLEKQSPEKRDKYANDVNIPVSAKCINPETQQQVYPIYLSKCCPLLHDLIIFLGHNALDQEIEEISDQILLRTKISEWCTQQNILPQDLAKNLTQKYSLDQISSQVDPLDQNYESTVDNLRKTAELFIFQSIQYFESLLNNSVTSNIQPTLTTVARGTNSSRW